jgi:ATP-dependent metalloprotease
LAGIVAGATATNPSSLRSSYSGVGGGGSDTSKPLYVRIMPNCRSFSSFTFRVLIGFVAISAIATLRDEKRVGKALGVTQSGKHIQEAENSNVRFDDVKGVGEAKAELEEIVEFLKDQTKFTRLGGKLPRGLLLIGPPGTGKTLLAKAVAGEAGVPFFFSSGSQFEEVYVGLGARRVRELFDAAKKKAPCIVFIDEIDALGGSRKLKDQSALKMTLNELLVQLDGFEDNTGIIVIGATNFADSLDPALLRPGRFDKHVSVPLPDIGGRKEIWKCMPQNKIGRGCGLGRVGTWYHRHVRCGFVQFNESSRRQSQCERIECH